MKTHMSLLPISLEAVSHIPGFILTEVYLGVEMKGYNGCDFTSQCTWDVALYRSFVTILRSSRRAVGILILFLPLIFAD